MKLALATSLIASLNLAAAAPAGDLVTTGLPGFPDHREKFQVYSGFLNVTR